MIDHRRARRAAIPTPGPAVSPAERDRAILDERARLLARRPEGPAAGDAIEVIVLRMGEERHALETRFVRQVARPAACTPIPGCPGALVGLVNLGGEVLAVFDPGLALGVGAAEKGPRSRVVVLGVGRDELGLWVDEASEVTAIRATEVLAPPAPRDGRDLLLGVTAGGMGVIDGAALLADGRFFIG